jgi:hypothetical protein
MSHGVWVRRFSADPHVIRRGLRFQDAVYTIVGVMPEGFDYCSRADNEKAMISGPPPSKASCNRDAVYVTQSE